MLEIDDETRIPLAELRFTFVRSSGPGGQNVNKVASKAVLRWNPAESQSVPMPVLERFRKLFPRCWTGDGEIVITSQRTRDALKNRNDCLEKLRQMLQKAVREPKRRIPTKPTKGSIRRRLKNKSRQSEKKQGRRKVDPE